VVSITGMALGWMAVRQWEGGALAPLRLAGE